ncbi:hypothetical protein HYW46_02795 [Candidatus Daviesbacteria bacterium]|nr:hypothetical protein [Candidatus Daviesbacteria bacterium]
MKAAFLMDHQERDTCIRIYSKHIAGVTIPEEVRDREWLNQVGKNLNGVGEKPKNNGVIFWQEISKLVPELLSHEELSWLMENDPKGTGGFDLCCNMYFFGHSLLASMFGVSVHAWK